MVDGGGGGVVVVVAGGVDSVLVETLVVCTGACEVVVPAATLGAIVKPVVVVVGEEKEEEEEEEKEEEEGVVGFDVHPALVVAIVCKNVDVASVSLFVGVVSTTVTLLVVVGVIDTPSVVELDDMLVSAEVVVDVAVVTASGKPVVDETPREGETAVLTAFEVNTLAVDETAEEVVEVEVVISTTFLP